MPTDRLLVTLLRTLQTHSDQQDTSRILGTAASLYTTLSNPLNLTLLTAQLLNAPAIWTRPEGLRTCLRFTQVFQSAAVSILKYEDEKAEHAQKGLPLPPASQPLGGSLSRREWVKSVLSGADDRSPRWRHILVISGLLIGFEAQGRGGLAHSLRQTLEGALVKAVNLVLLEQKPGTDELAANAVAMALNYSFELLSDTQRAQINYDRLLPALVFSAFFSPSEGYRSGYFFATIEPDIEQTAANKFSWSERSRSFNQLKMLSQQPNMASMGPLARLIAHCVENCRDSWLIEPLMDDLVRFANTIAGQWRRCKLSEVDASEEALYYGDETVQKTLPLLFQVFRSALFAVVIVLRAIVGRVLNDRQLAGALVAPTIASNSLHILRHLYFLTTRLGPSTFSLHTFVHLACIDILAAYPERASAFLYSIKPQAAPGAIPSAPLDRNLDLFFLNTAEHFALVLEPRVNEELLIGAATPYLDAGGHNQLLDIFEAAHSVMLSTLSAGVGRATAASAAAAIAADAPGPDSERGGITARYMPFYVDTLFRVFPSNLSARQFRLAFRTLVDIASTPSAPAGFADTLMDILHHRAQNCPSISSDNSSSSGDGDGNQSEPERTTLTLSLIEALPALSLHLLETWLPLAAELVPSVGAAAERAKCTQRFWSILSDGELDPVRSLVAVRWWCSGGGREQVLGIDLSRRARGDALMAIAGSKL